MSTLEDYFPRDLAQLIKQTTIITPQIAFSSTEGFILNKDGVLLSSLGHRWTRITRFSYVNNVLGMLNVEGNVSPERSNIHGYERDNIVQLVGNYILLNSGTVIDSKSRPVVGGIVQIMPHYGAALTLNNKYEVGYVIGNEYRQLVLIGPVVKLHDDVVELLDGSLISASAFGCNTPTNFIKHQEDVSLDVKYELHIKANYVAYLSKTEPQSDPYLSVMWSTSVLDFVKTGQALIILKVNGETIMWGQNSNRLFGLPIELLEPTLIANDNVKDKEEILSTI